MSDDRPRRVLRCLLSAIYITAGTAHIFLPRPFVMITPDWVPSPLAVIVFTGLCEVAGGVGLLIPTFRRGAGAMLALYALCVFPANLKHAFEGIDIPPIPNSWWYHAPRLALQPVLVWLPLYSTSLIDWPARSRRHGQS
jgi:uncharacterized membrane protein